MIRRSEILCAGGTLECSSAGYRLWPGSEGGSSAAALQGLRYGETSKLNSASGPILLPGAGDCDKMMPC